MKITKQELLDIIEKRIIEEAHDRQEIIWHAKYFICDLLMGNTKAIEEWKALIRAEVSKDEKIEIV